MKKWYERFHDEEFVRYNETGEAAAVHIVRDLASDVDTTGKWIDVISMDKFQHQSGKIGFNWIIVELFPRITQPEYTDDTEHNRYICWQTAHADIDWHRRKNHHGKKFIVLCKLWIKKEIYMFSEEEIFDYEVLASHKIKQKQVNYVQQNKDAIISQIQKQHKPNLSMFHISENT